VALPGSREFRRWLRNQGHLVKALEDSAFTVVREALGAARVVTGFCQEDREKDRFIAKAGAATRVRLRLALAEGGFLVFAAGLAVMGMAAVLWLGLLTGFVIQRLDGARRRSARTDAAGAAIHARTGSGLRP